MITEALWRGLIHSSLVCGLVLAVGTLPLRFVRAPADQLRIIQLVFVTCLVAPWIAGVSTWKSISLNLLSPSGQQASHDLAVSAGQHGTKERAEQLVADLGSSADVIGAGHSNNASPIQQSLSKFPAVDRLAASIRIVDTILVAYLMALVSMLVWWGRGLRRVYLLERSARVANPELQSLLTDMSKALRRPIRLLVSDKVTSPMTWGLLRPVILLPTQFEKSPNWPQLRWCLAHELSHVERRDVGTLVLASLVQLTCFHQPFYWWLRHRMTLCQDHLADARVVNESDSVEDYAAFLVRLARSQCQPHLPVVLGMAPRKSSLFRRITFLLSNDGRVCFRCSRATSVGSLIVAMGLLGSLSTVHLDASGNVASLALAPPERVLQSPQIDARRTAVVADTISAKSRVDEIDVNEAQEPGRSEWFTLRGQLVDYAGRPLPNAHLRLIASTDLPTGIDDNKFNWALIETGQLGQKPYCDQFLSGITNEDGRFEFTQILAGRSVQLAFWGPGTPQGKSLAFDETIAGKTEDVRIQLPEPAQLRGTIDRSRFPDAESVQLNRESFGQQSRTMLLKVDQTEFAFEDLPPGEYSLFLLAQAKPTAAGRFVFAGKALRRVSIRLHPGQIEESHFGADGVTPSSAPSSPIPRNIRRESDDLAP